MRRRAGLVLVGLIFVGLPLLGCDEGSDGEEEFEDVEAIEWCVEVLGLGVTANGAEVRFHDNPCLCYPLGEQPWPESEEEQRVFDAGVAVCEETLLELGAVETRCSVREDPNISPVGPCEASS